MFALLGRGWAVPRQAGYEQDARCGQGTVGTETINLQISLSVFAQAIGVDVYSTVLAFNSFDVL